MDFGLVLPQGAVITPDDDAYATENTVFNVTQRLEPALVAAAESAADVQAAVRFAAQRGLPVAVKSSGHQVIQPAHGAVLITTDRMNRIEVDPATRIARVEAGVRWQQLIDAAYPHGLAPLSGSSPLFWAVRGGKGNFGVVTAIEFSLFPVPVLYGGGIYFAGERTADVLRTWANWVPYLPWEMSTSVPCSGCLRCRNCPDHCGGPS